MTSITENKARQRLANVLVMFAAVLVFAYWGRELSLALDAHARHAEEVLIAHQVKELERKAEELRDTFEELYTNTRTISLLPMVRVVSGENRRSATEDVVANGRLSVDAHRVLQQIYTNLNSHIHISEIYYVLDGFDAARGDVPFFMYDDLISADSRRASTVKIAESGRAVEVEDFEYAHFSTQLSWFREFTPHFVFGEQLDKIPVRLSPMMRTCDNSQFPSEQHGNLRDVEGIVFSMPVYDLKSNAFKGMIATILRRNVLEARLIGVPFLPVTEGDREKMAKERWSMPEPSAFVLKNNEYGIEIADRRNTMLAEGVLSAQARPGGRWRTIQMDYKTGATWDIYHYLSPSEIEALTADVRASRQETIFGRVALLILLVMLLAWVGWLLRRSRRELMWMANYDSLTELPNRRAFFERLSAVMSRAKRSESRAGLFFVDIAGFNAINDTFGQQVGDRLLIAVARRLVDCIRESDMVVRNPLTTQTRDSVSRLGGDEFTILCDDLKSSDDLAFVADRIMLTMHSPIVIDGNEIEVSLYMGIAAFPEDAATGEALLMAAEGAMQQCRQDGPGYLLYNEQMRRRAARQHHLSVELQLAHERKQFELFYQPKADLQTGRVVSFEALLRWRHPELGLISPAEFIPLLERSGRIVAVGEWVIAQSCRDLNVLSELGYGDIRISANVSVRQLRRDSFHEDLGRVMSEHGTTPDRLILEITESMVMEDLQEGQQALERLKALGVRLAIDDFGTGFSSLTYLQYLPLDYLKLDKSFIDGMTNDRARHIVKAVIVLAQGLSLHTIAEGIEMEVQRDELREMGCDQIQGYLLSKPKPLEEIILWLRAQQR